MRARGYSMASHSSPRGCARRCTGSRQSSGSYRALALYGWPMATSSYAREHGRADLGHESAAPDHRYELRHLHLTGSTAIPSSSPASPAEADDCAKSREEDPLSDGVPQDSSSRLCRQRGLARRRHSALENTSSSHINTRQKSHSAGYALIAYRTAFLNANHPTSTWPADLVGMNTRDRSALRERCAEMGSRSSRRTSLLPKELRRRGGKDPLRLMP